MSMYLDGIQEIEDTISDFTIVANGTITVGTNQFPSTTWITKPTKIYRNYVLLCSNKTGQTISNVHMMARNLLNNSPLPNTDTIMSLYLKVNLTVSNGVTGTRGAVDLTSEEPNPFVMGQALFQFNLAAAPTSGTIDWALIGY
jgi:hypothetical protein